MTADEPKEKALADDIQAFWFYDLRAEAADDMAEMHSKQAAADLLDHDSCFTTQLHYLRHGKIIGPSR